MAAPAGNGSLLAGLGAFAVVVGGLAAYKHVKSAPTAPKPAASGILAPDQAVQPEPPALKSFIDNELARGFALLGKTEADMRAAFPQQRVEFGDATQYFTFPEFADDDDAFAQISFYVTDGVITKVAGTVTRANERNAAELITQADQHWQVGTLERSARGLGLTYRGEGVFVFATHLAKDNQWIFTATPSEETDDNTIGIGRFGSAACDVVDRIPHHFGAGKNFTLGQSEAAVLNIAKRTDPDNSHTFNEGSLALFSWMTDVDLVLSVKGNKLQSLIYTLPDARAEEVVACWSDPALSLANDTYWKRGNERYRLHGTTLEIARIERMADFVTSLATGLGKPYEKVADVAARYRVTSIPDWSISTYVNPQSKTAIADDEEVTTFVVFASYDGDAGQREHLLQDIESGTGLAELVRNPHNVPVLRATHNGALFETEQFNGTKLVLNVSTATTR